MEEEGSGIGDRDASMVLSAPTIQRPPGSNPKHTINASFNLYY